VDPSLASLDRRACDRGSCTKPDEAPSADPRKEPLRARHRSRRRTRGPASRSTWRPRSTRARVARASAGSPLHRQLGPIVLAASPAPIVDPSDPSDRSNPPSAPAEADVSQQLAPSPPGDRCPPARRRGELLSETSPGALGDLDRGRIRATPRPSRAAPITSAHHRGATQGRPRETRGVIASSHELCTWVRSTK
jgi:hypothetical protein